MTWDGWVPAEKLAIDADGYTYFKKQEREMAQPNPNPNPMPPHGPLAPGGVPGGPDCPCPGGK